MTIGNEQEDQCISAAWAPYATNLLDAVKLPSAHYPMEEAPEETFRALHAFFKSS